MSRSVFRSDDGIIRDTRGIRRFKCSSVDDESSVNCFTRKYTLQKIVYSLFSPKMAVFALYRYILLSLVERVLEERICCMNTKNMFQMNGARA